MGKRIEFSKVSWKSPDVKKNISEMVKDNSYIFSFQNYEFLDVIRNKPNIHYLTSFLKLKIQLFECRLDDKVLMYFPLYINDKTKNIYLWGHFQNVAHCDLLYYSNLSLAEFQECISLIKKHFSIYTMNFSKISQYSLTYSYLSHLGYTPIETEKCVEIRFNSYDEWYQSLSKNSRQNIRTAMNRLQREEKRIECKFYYEEECDNYDYHEHLKLLSQRIIEHSNLKKILYYPMIFHKKHDAISIGLNHDPNHVLSCLYLDGVLFASLEGIVSNGKLIVSRLSMNSKFKVYCPGGLLLSETIMRVEKKHIYCLDLSRGDEKYKYTYGGTEHYNYSFKL